MQAKTSEQFYFLTAAHLIRSLVPRIEWNERTGGIKPEGIVFFSKYTDLKSEYDYFTRLSDCAVGYYGMYKGVEVDVLAIEVNSTRSLSAIYRFDQINNLSINDACIMGSSQAADESEVLKQSKNYEAAQVGFVDRCKHRLCILDPFPTAETMLIVKNMNTKKSVRRPVGESWHDPISRQLRLCYRCSVIGSRYRGAAQNRARICVCQWGKGVRANEPKASQCICAVASGKHARPKRPT